MKIKHRGYIYKNSNKYVNHSPKKVRIRSNSDEVVQGYMGQEFSVATIDEKMRMDVSAGAEYFVKLHTQRDQFGNLRWR